MMPNLKTYRCKRGHVFAVTLHSDRIMPGDVGDTAEMRDNPICIVFGCYAHTSLAPECEVETKIQAAYLVKMPSVCGLRDHTTGRFLSAINANFDVVSGGHKLRASIPSGFVFESVDGYQVDGAPFPARLIDDLTIFKRIK